jgi:tRNA(Ile)-lysidine synthase
VRGNAPAANSGRAGGGDPRLFHAGDAGRPLDAVEFAALMAPLGPWPASRRVAVAVSGGADSLCLALLAAGWGKPVGLIIDHGLRSESATEACVTQARLARIGVPGRIIRLQNLAPGPALAARARAARYEALTSGALDAGCLDLLLGHHRGDQAETLVMRRGARSGPAGLAAMPRVTHTAALRLLRPLLDVPAIRLRATLRAAGLAWVEDPSNHNQAALRTRIRLALGEAGGEALDAAATDASRYAMLRAAAEHHAAGILAARAALYPEGYATLAPGPIPPGALASLLQAIGGNPYPPNGAALARLAANPVPAVLAGVRLLAAGRLGPGLLVVREQAAMQPPVAATPGTMWDGRFYLAETALPAPDATLGALGAEAARLRHASRLPFAVLATLPALRVNGALAVVPHIGYPDVETCARMAIMFRPPIPVAGAPFGA